MYFILNDTKLQEKCIYLNNNLLYNIFVNKLKDNLGDNMIYFDNAATTKIDDEVLATYIKIQQNFFANTTSLHKLGQEANYMFDKAKMEFLNALKLNNHDCIYVSNATEANNIAIYGFVQGKKGKVITTKVEHPSVSEIFKDLENKGYEVVYLDVDEDGVIDLDMLESELNSDTLLVSVMWVNNIIGTIEPIDKVIKLIKKYPKCKLHVDAVQGLCKAPNSFNLNDVDAFTFSTHKIYGPKQIGGLVLKNNLELAKILHGSSSQKGLKPGTIDLALVCATTKAIKKFNPLVMGHYEKVKKLAYRFIDGVKDNDEIIINSPVYKDFYLPYIVNISIPRINGETIIHALESKDIYVSTGSSCSSKLKKPEPTIYAISHDDKRATTSIRISFSYLNTMDEVDKLIDELNKITKRK